MGLFAFIKDAGEKLLGVGEAKAATPTTDAAAANAAAGKAVENYIAKMNLSAENLTVGFNGANGEVTVSGKAATQEIKEKILLCCGNVKGVSKVVDNMEVAEKAVEPRFYTVVSGDTLSKIAKQHYGNANLYMKIFEANRPMLSHPDKIYPGQTLRIPD
ncbi:MAG: peptidoglycan-binding protein LysM [Methylophilaceae bacterium]|jgi:nucleoid-associated protein YgaU|nr:peptidoglycan-binding protein LysM [Methylophilaceae bacterium]